MSEGRDPIDRLVDVAVAVPVSVAVAVGRAVPAAWRAAQRRALPVVDAFAEPAAEFADEVDELAADTIDHVTDEVPIDDVEEVAVDAAEIEAVEIEAVEVGLTAEELPIEDYDALAARQVVARLADLFPEELDAVERYEIAHRHRQTVLHRIAQLRA